MEKIEKRVSSASRTPLTYPLMPADALNLIIHMKLHVNGKIGKRRDR